MRRSTANTHERLHGRTAPLRHLRRLLEEPRLPGAVLVGPAGIGKSSVAESFGHEARDQGWDVWVGHANPLDARLPFAPLVEALHAHAAPDDHHTEEMTRLLRQTDPSADDAPHLRWRVTDLVIDVLDAAARKRPVLLLIEDLHWADLDTLATVGRLWRAARHLELAVLATTRPDPLKNDLTTALQQAQRSGCLVHDLEELSEKDIRAIAIDMFKAPPGPRLSSFLRKTGGNPFYAIELLTLLDQQGRISKGDRYAEVDQSLTDEVVSTTLVRRLEIVSPTLRQVLSQAAILGRHFELDELALLRDESPTATWDNLRLAASAGLLTEEHERFRFRHDLIHEALYAELPSGVRKRLHDDAADALAHADTSAERVGAHLARGSLKGERPSRLLSLAEIVADRAPDLAASWVRDVQRVLPPDDPARLRAQLVEAKTAALSDNPEEAVRIARGCLGEGVDPETAAELWATIAQAEHYVGTTSTETTMALADIITLVPDDYPRKGRLAALAARALRAIGRPAEAMELARSALTVAVGDAGARCVALGMLARQALEDGDTEAAFELADRGLDLARASGTLLDWTGIEVVKDFGWVPAIDCDDQRLVEVCREIIGAAERLGLAAALPAIQAELAETLRFRGHWVDAQVYAQAALDGLDASRYASVEADAWFTLLSMAARRGEAQLFDRMPSPLKSSESNISLRSLAIDHAWALEHSGQAARAWEVAESARTWFENEAPDFMFVWSHPYMRLALSRGERDRAKRFMRLIEAAAERMGNHPIILAQARMANALLNNDRDIAAEALRLARLGPVFPNRVDALILAGEIFSETDRDAAIAYLQEARDLAVAAEATVDIARTDAALRELGLIARRRRKKPTVGWEALTEVETRVMNAVVDGLTYREVGERLYISRRTVETHIASVFRKVGVRSRNELTAAWHSRSTDTSST